MLSLASGSFPSSAEGSSCASLLLDDLPGKKHGLLLLFSSPGSGPDLQLA